MVQCITSTRFNLWADVLRMGADGSSDIPVSEQGTHVVRQNPRTGAIIREWVPVVDDSKGDELFKVPCDVTSVVDGGIRVAGTTERFNGKIYDNADFAHMTLPAKYKLSKRDRITNVRTKKTGNIIWVEEELDEINGVYPATIFDILGINPIKDPYGNHIENRVLMARVDLSDS